MILWVWGGVMAGFYEQIDQDGNRIGWQAKVRRSRIYCLDTNKRYCLTRKVAKG